MSLGNPWVQPARCFRSALMTDGPDNIAVKGD